MKEITLKEVVEVWRNVCEEAVISKATNVNEGIRIGFPNGTYFEINTEQIYSNQKVFSMTVNRTLKAINLTVEYLKKTKIER